MGQIRQALFVDAAALLNVVIRGKMGVHGRVWVAPV